MRLIIAVNKLLADKKMSLRVSTVEQAYRILKALSLVPEELK